VDYHAARLPECLRCLLVVRSTCHFAHVLWLVSIWLADSARRIGKSRTPLAANDHCRRGPTDNAPLHGDAESGAPTFSPGALGWPDRSWCERRALFGRAQSPDKPLLYRFAEREAISILPRLRGRQSFILQRQMAVQLCGSSAALRSIGGRSRERVSRGETSNGETRRASNTEQRSKDDFWSETSWPGDS
jgi:hypothetical protein